MDQHPPGEPLIDSETVIYTDGACKGNPGPGGWAWAVVGGAWGSGFDPQTTNQRMEIMAAYQAVVNNSGRLRIVSDSTYVVNCFRDGWWKGWRQRGWKNSKKDPVANRDLWEPFIDLVETRDVTFEWVKGHSGNEMNDLVDRLAVAAVERRKEDSGEQPPSASQLGPPDAFGIDGTQGDPEPGETTAAATAAATTERFVARDRRVPDGSLWSVVGVRSTELLSSESGVRLRRKLAEILEAHQQMHGDVVVLSGARPGAEQLGALAASDAGIPYVVILPYPDPVPSSAGAEWERFSELCEGAASVVTLESKRPTDGKGRTAALSRRDGWLRSVSSGAVVVTAADPGETGSASRSTSRSTGAVGATAIAAAQDQLTKFTKALGDEVWELPLEV